MKRVLFLALALVLVSCKGEKGDKGDTGNANVQAYSGVVTSDDQLVFVTGTTTDNAVAVSVLIGGSYLGLPFYNVSGGYDVAFAFRNGVVELLNAQSAGATYYKIFVIQKTGGFGINRLES